MADDIRSVVKGIKRGDEVSLPHGCFDEQLAIGKPCLADGSGTLLWSERGTPLTIKSRGVSLRGMRLMSLSGDALYIHKDTQLDGVEVFGKVRGKGGFEDSTSLPPVILLGQIHAGGTSEYTVKITVSCAAEIISRCPSVAVSPTKLHAGGNSVTFTVSGVQSGFSLMAEMELRTSVIRRFYLYGKAVSGGTERCCGTVSLLDHSLTVSGSSERIERGGRYIIDEYKDCELFLRVHSGAIPTGLRYYMLALDSDNRLPDRSFIIDSSEPLSPDGAICYINRSDASGFRILLPRLDSRADALYLYIAGRAEPMPEEFYLHADGHELCSFDLSERDEDSACCLAKIYRYKGQWRIASLCAGLGSDINSFINERL